MERVQSISQQLYTTDSLDILEYNFLYDEEENSIRKRFREVIQREIQPHINEYIEKAQFPTFVRQKLKEFGLFKLFVGPPYGEGRRTRLIGILISEMARIDSGLSLFMLVQWSVLMTTIEWFGSEHQKQLYLPKLIDCDQIGGWALTEPNFGSDASGLESNVKETDGGFILNGSKRWIGNGNGDIVVVWAKNQTTKQIEGFIVELTQKGVTRQVIEHKLAVRMVQNYHLTFENVFIPINMKLPLATSFQESTNKILKHSRIVAVWISSGIARGVCDRVLQFLKPKQKPKKKVLSMISNTQSILLMAWRISELYDSKQLTLGQVALAKSYATTRAREICIQAKDLLEGVGIYEDHYVLKAMLDIEATHTYEGTYDINALVAGRELTGLSAFKVRNNK
ncbi:hypothetical protein ABPG74_014258 [Tetrahymena malaccensis]